ENSLVRILTEPKNALVKQYRKLFEYDDIELEIEQDALISIAKKAISQKTGARGLRSIIEAVLMKTMYSVPSDGSIAKVTVTAESVEGTAQPILTNRRNKIVDFTDIA
ncbi:MAG: ATP-dependent Clp protease ATP-binding subunit ClpX, partial [Ruminococcus sp.]|nr:ATP-dependent Clp protease ATP-binding subunit ClpX [Ruminococcus sp.]